MQQFNDTPLGEMQLDGWLISLSFFFYYLNNNKILEYYFQINT